MITDPDLAYRLLRHVGRLRAEARLYLRSSMTTENEHNVGHFAALSEDYHLFAEDLITVLEAGGVYVHPELKKR